MLGKLGQDGQRGVGITFQLISFSQQSVEVSTPENEVIRHQNGKTILNKGTTSPGVVAMRHCISLKNFRDSNVIAIAEILTKAKHLLSRLSELRRFQQKMRKSQPLDERHSVFTDRSPGIPGSRQNATRSVWVTRPA